MTRTNEAVLYAARAGDRAAFAALMARTAPMVYALLPRDSDRYRQLHDVYLRAMRELSHGAEPDDVDEWLSALVAKTKPRRDRRNTRHSFSPETDLDELWHELSHMWPTGRRRMRLAIPKTAIAGLVVLLLAGIITLFGSQTAQQSADTLRATVYQPDQPETTEDDRDETAGDTPVVPVIPLPPPSADDPRPTPPQVSPDNDSSNEPDDTRDNDSETEQPDEVPDDAAPEEDTTG